jgi:hypothetical protein
MPFADTQGGGVDVSFPDVCNTPPGPVPIPYGNAACGSAGTPPVPHVLWSGAPAHNIGTIVPTSNGDNAGVALGVMSGTVMGESKHITASATLVTGGQRQTRTGSISSQNGGNALGARLVPSQFKVLVLTP